MNLLTLWLAFMFAYWFCFKRETRREREYREEQQRKASQWNKNNMNKYK